MPYAKSLLGAFLTTILLSAPAAAQTAEDLKKAIDKLEKATKDLQEAKDAMKTEEIRAKAISIETNIKLIDADIQEIKKDIRDIKRRLGDGGADTGTRSESKYQGQGRVRLINQFGEEMSVVVNGVVYRLQPGSERLIAVPPGDFTYQVLQLQREAQLRKIAADETKNVRIFPLP